MTVLSSPKDGVVTSPFRQSSLSAFLEESIKLVCARACVCVCGDSLLEFSTFVDCLDVINAVPCVFVVTCVVVDESGEEAGDNLGTCKL